MKEGLSYLLCTRPVTPAQERKAEAEGVVLHGISFIETFPLEEEVLSKKVAALATQKINVIFTSMNAVETVAGMVEKAHPSKSKKRVPQWRIYSIGGRTSQLAKELFPFSELIAEASYGHLLAKKILLENPKGPIVFFCGNIRRKELPEELKKNGLFPEEITVYQTISTPVPLDQKYDGVLFFSPSAVESYFSLNPVQPGQYFFAIGQTTAEAIKAFTMENILFAPTTDKDALIDTALSFFSKKADKTNT